jgi:hypothetical protein
MTSSARSEGMSVGLAMLVRDEQEKVERAVIQCAEISLT